MEIRTAGDNVLRGTAQGILLVAVRGTGDVLRTVKSPIVHTWFKEGFSFHFGRSSKRRYINNGKERVARPLTLEPLVCS